MIGVLLEQELEDLARTSERTVADADELLVLGLVRGRHVERLALEALRVRRRVGVVQRLR